MGKYELVAPCGDYCGGCGQYNGLIVETAKQMREFAGFYGFEFRSEGAFDFKQFVKGIEWFIENSNCSGCRQGGGPAWCEVKKCCSGKGLRICFECEEFPCSKFKDYADPDSMDRYKRFKEIGFDKWVEIKAIKFRSSSPKKIETAALSYGLMGGRANGDEFLSIRRSNSLFLALIDVLGHGRAAHEIAIEAKRFLEDQHYLKLDEIMNNLHDHLRGDRGAMVELMRLDPNKKILEFCGVGDVSCRIYSGNNKRSIPIFTVDGIVGETLRKTNLQRLELPEDAVIAMFSDGISQSFDVPLVSLKQ